MERNYDEVISDILIDIEKMKTDLTKFFEDFGRRMAKAERRADLSIRRLIKLELRAEEFDKKLALSIANLEQTNRNLVLFGQKLERSIKDQELSSRRQAEINENFLKQLRKNGHK